MQDRPTATELLGVVRHFLEKEVVPKLEGRRRFHALVSANVLAIVERELTGGEERLLGEWRRLATLLGADESPPARLDALREGVRALDGELTDRIRNGDADDGEFGDAVRRHLRTTVVEKLRVASPRFLGEA